MVLLQNRVLKTAKGITPAVCLINPKYPQNVASVLRAAACFDIKQVWYTGSRIKYPERIPRELRLKQYMTTELINDNEFLERFPKKVHTVAVELVNGAQDLPTFEHNYENTLYIFGAEDSSIPSSILRHCKEFVQIPTKYCINLSAAVYLTLYDRQCKLERSTNPWIN